MNSETTLDEYTSSDSGVIFTVEANDENMLRHGELLEREEVFSYASYNSVAPLPHPLAEVDVSALQKQYTRCLDMPLRLPGEQTYALPQEWRDLLPIVTHLAAIEQKHNHHWQNYHTYLTIDSSLIVAGEQQRHGGLHVDGFQGARIFPKDKVTRNYVVTTNGGTRFYRQPFTVVDPEKFNVFEGFDLQAQPDPFIAEENLVYFMDAYTVHESGISLRSGLRTFLRLTFDVKRFDRQGNTHNSMLAYNWDMYQRNVHSTVQTPTIEDVRRSPYCQGD